MWGDIEVWKSSRTHTHTLISDSNNDTKWSIVSNTDGQ